MLPSGVLKDDKLRGSEGLIRHRTSDQCVVLVLYPPVFNSFV